jgi:hypothetical protein
VARLLMMSVTGGSTTPYLKLVSVEDPVQFLGLMRLQIMQAQIEKLSKAPALPDDAQAEILRTLKVKLYETGLNEYPETDAEVEALYRRFSCK